MKKKTGGLVVALLLGSPGCHASCSWSHLDHEIAFSNSGAWSPNSYRGLMDALTIAQVAGAFYEGSQSRLGRTMWQGADSEALAAVASNGAKFVFTRERPAAGNDPCKWFQGGSNYSFPSGEAATAAGLVAPYIIEYAHDRPAVYALLAIPAYVGVGRLRNHAHWQSDVIAGWAIGGVSGWYAHGRERPFFVSILPRGFTAGYRKSF